MAKYLNILLISSFYCIFFVNAGELSRPASPKPASPRPGALTENSSLASSMHAEDFDKLEGDALPTAEELAQLVEKQKEQQKKPSGGVVNWLTSFVWTTKQNTPAALPVESSDATLLKEVLLVSVEVPAHGSGSASSEPVRKSSELTRSQSSEQLATTPVTDAAIAACNLLLERKKSPSPTSGDRKSPEINKGTSDIQQVTVPVAEPISAPPVTALASEYMSKCSAASVFQNVESQVSASNNTTGSTSVNTVAASETQMRFPHNEQLEATKGNTLTPEVIRNRLTNNSGNSVVTQRFNVPVGRDNEERSQSQSLLRELWDELKLFGQELKQDFKRGFALAGPHLSHDDIADRNTHHRTNKKED